MSQSRLKSLGESVTQTTVGYVFAIITQIVAFPLIFGITPTLPENLLVGLIFMAVSLFRSYIIRRLFERWEWIKAAARNLLDRARWIIRGLIKKM